MNARPPSRGAAVEEELFTDIHDTADMVRSLAVAIREAAFRRDDMFIRIYRVEFIRQARPLRRSGPDRGRESEGGVTSDRNAEGRIQASIVDWIRTVAPGTLVFAVPNGGLRSKTEAARLKWQGVLAGVPDLIVLAPVGRVFALEVKTEVGRLSESQKEIFGSLVALGVQRAIVRSIDDVRRAFSAWGIETREARQ
jgi:VRR-NUC domain